MSAKLLEKISELCSGVHCVRSIATGFILITIMGCPKEEPQKVRASDLVYKYFQIDNSRVLTDENIQEAVFKIISVGSSVNEIFEKMANTGLGAGHCAPGENDGGPFSGMPYCGIRSSEGACGKEYENYNIFFIVDKNPGMTDILQPGATKLRDIKIYRWVRTCK